MNPEVNIVAVEAVAAVAKASELFIADFARRAFDIAGQNKRKTIKVDDIYASIQNDFSRYEFLNEAFGNTILLKPQPKGAPKNFNINNTSSSSSSSSNNNSNNSYSGSAKSAPTKSAKKDSNAEPKKTLASSAITFNAAAASNSNSNSNITENKLGI